MRDTSMNLPEGAGAGVGVGVGVGLALVVTVVVYVRTPVADIETLLTTTWAVAAAGRSLA